MKQFFLTEILTKDNLIHQGIYFEPKKKSDTAMLWVHGLSSTFTSHVSTCDALADICDKYHIGFAAFNNRGAKFIDGIQKRDPSDPKGYTHVPGGAGQEKFEECISDIDAGITFLINQGYKKVVLVGRSTGANKSCFYAGTVNDPRLAGVVLVSPISDRLEMVKTRTDTAAITSYMKEQILAGKGDIPMFGFNFFPLTPNRYLSLIEKGSKEDVFDYGDDEPKLRVFSRIQKPLYVILGENDEHADRPVADIKKAFDTHTKSKKYTSRIVSGALHGFGGIEKELADLVGDWIDCTLKLC
jgi:dienelactone hydrolase